MIGICNYGLGNINAFENIYKNLGADYKIILKPDELINVDGIILPGVGSFDSAIKSLENSGFKEPLMHCISEIQTPILGVCVGMQMLANYSEEGQLEGLGLISGVVKKMILSQNSPLPHMGWNSIAVNGHMKLFDGLDINPYFYFLHSYAFDVSDGDCETANFIHGEKQYISSIAKKNIYGVQFHPEKSHNNGIRVLKNFSDIVKCSRR